MRSTRSDIYKKIIDSIKTNEKTILQISNDTKINWETVKNAIETLNKIGIINHKDSNGKTYYYMDESQLIQLNPNTLLGIEPKEEKLTLQIAKRIEELWEKRFNKIIKRTFLQKLLIKLIKQENLPIPYGWYLYGQCTVSMLNSNKEISTKKYDAKIEILITEFGKIPNTTELMRLHYTEEQNDLYLTRLKINEILMNRFEDKTLLKIQINTLLYSFKTNDIKLREIINGFASIIFRLINSLKLEELEDIRNIINDTFGSIWEIIATHELKKSLERFYKSSEIEKFYSLQIENLKLIADEHLLNLKSYCPEIKIRSDIERFKGIIKETKTISKEERNKLFEEFEKDKSDIFGKYNL